MAKKQKKYCINKSYNEFRRDTHTYLLVWKNFYKMRKPFWEKISTSEWAIDLRVIYNSINVLGEKGVLVGNGEGGLLSLIFLQRENAISLS